MKKGLYFIMFIAGGVIGSATAWYYAKQKYEKIAREEIASVKDVFSRKNREENDILDEEEPENPRAAAEQAKWKADVAEYASVLQRTGYGKRSGAADGQEDVDMKSGPYVISPEEFGEFEDYETLSFTCYADGVVTDDGGDILEDVEETVGDALNHFGEYEDDSVFVRCDEKKCDYEILLDQREFQEVLASGPRQVEV